IWAGAVITGSVDGGADPGKETQISHLLLTGDDNKTTELRAHSFRTVQITGGDWKLGEGTDLRLEEMEVAGGRFVVGDSTSINVTELSLQNGGRLEGDGELRSHVQNNDGGVLAPGMSPGTITIVGSYTHNEGATYEAEIFGNGDHDQLRVEKDAADPDNTGLVTIEGGRL